MTREERDGLRRLMELLAIPGISGREKKVADYAASALLSSGCSKTAVRFDGAARALGGGFECGNLVARIPGTAEAPGLMFAAHLDTVPLCQDAIARRKGRRIVPAGRTALGGDDRAGAALVLSVCCRLLEERPLHGPITAVFTIGEEVGLKGSSVLNTAMLGRPQIGFNFDGGSPREITIGAIGAVRWEADIRGIAAHAAVSPQKGVSAITAASQGIAALEAAGLLGRVRGTPVYSTGNVGIVRGGDMTNQVCDHVFIKGESRSHDPAQLRHLASRIEACLRGVPLCRGTGRLRAAVDFRKELDYLPFKLDVRHPAVQYTAEVMKKTGLRPRFAVSNGGLDASNFNNKGIPTVTLGAGQHSPHSVEEFIDLDEFFQALRFAYALATSPALLCSIASAAEEGR